MRRLLMAASAALALVSPAVAAVKPFPAPFQVRDIPVGDAVIHVRVGGHGPAVVMLHGFGDTGDMWQPLAVAMATDHTVIVPDLRGMGLSSHPEDGYDKKTQGRDIAGVLTALGVGHVDLVTHDIGNMVGFAFAAENPGRVEHWVAMDAPLPGVGHWDEIKHEPGLWHFNFRGPDEERLVAGRERIYLDRFWDELSANPATIDEETRAHYAGLYALPHAIHDAFNQFGAFDQDAADNRAFLASGKLAMPVLAVGGDHSFGAKMAEEMSFAASNVKSVVIMGSGHWLMEEQPAATVAAITAFLDAPGVSSTAEARTRLTPGQIAAMAEGGAGTGTSGVAGIRTTVLSGDPDKPGLYALRIFVPPHTTIQPHTHRGDRAATVVSGDWWLGYGARVDPGAMRDLPPGGFYTEPDGQPHYARTGDAPTVVFITGMGPTDTVYVDAGDDPRGR